MLIPIKLDPEVGFCRCVRYVMVFLLVLLIAALRASHVSAQSTTSIVASPAVTNIRTGETATVNILINDYFDTNPPSVNGNGLYGADIQLSFNKNIVTVKDDITGQSGVQVTLGPLLTSQDSYFTLFNTASNSLGTIHLALTQLNPAVGEVCPSQPTPCTGVLLTIHFLGVSAGSSPVHFTYQKLSNPNGVQIPTPPAVASTIDAVINVTNPTATTIAEFSGRAVNDHQALLQWETGTELQLAGFNLWQSADGANYSKLNSEIISAKSPGQLIPNTYEFNANGLNSGKTYYYKLEALDSNGIPEWVGPVTISLPASCAGKLAAPALIAPVSKQVVSTHVTLDWSDVPCANAYRIQLRRDTVNGPNIKRTTTVSNLTTDVAVNHKYYWRVRTIAGKNRSNWSTWRSFTVLGTTNGK